MRQRLLLLAALAFALSLALLAAEVCPYCKYNAANGETVVLLQCKKCYHQYCSKCEVNRDGVYVCPWCKSGEGYPVGELGKSD